MTLPNGFVDLRALRHQQEERAGRQRSESIQNATDLINKLTSLIQSPGYKVWKEAVLSSAQAEHQKALSASTPHEMAIALGAEQAYRAAAHCAEDFIASNQNTVEAMKR